MPWSVLTRAWRRELLGKAESCGRPGEEDGKDTGTKGRRVCLLRLVRIMKMQNQSMKAMLTWHLELMSL